jgi:hypothetical protein
MPYLTNVELKNGHIAVRDANKTDTRHPLPKVEVTDRLASDKWGPSLRKETGVEDMALHAMADTHGAIVKAFNDLMTIRDNQSPEMTQAAHLKMLATSTQRTIDRLAEQATRAEKRADERIASIEAEAKKAMKFTRRGNEAEIRAILRGMDDKQRADVLAKAVESADGEILAAVFDSVHPLQAGMSADEHRNRFDQALHKHAPDLLRLRRGLEKGRALVRDSFVDLMERGEVISAKAIRDRYAAEQAAAEAAKRSLS